MFSRVFRTVLVRTGLRRLGDTAGSAASASADAAATAAAAAAAAAARDHRHIGTQQKLWMQHPLSPGSVFFLPHGMRILGRLQSFLRSEYRRRGYEEVETPQLFAKELWQTSGHWEHYHADMFGVTCGAHHVDQSAHFGPSEVGSAPAAVDNAASESAAAGTAPAMSGAVQRESLALKPMNCPAHCLIFGSTPKSYRDLPMRVADFGALHRNEARGALTGLTRLRRFHQDDAHIFCTREQLHDELVGCLQFLQFTYQSLSLPFVARLATRPASVLGESGEWDEAERALVQALQALQIPYTEDRGGGAFYAPKIDFAVTDSHGRAHQCGTIQADYQLPRRFALRYIGSDGQDHTPVILHRAILGSLERFVAILAEHTGGRWPLWLSPRQVAVCTVADRHVPAARRLVQVLRDADLYADADEGAERLSHKIRAAQLQQYNYIVVMGDREADAGQVTARLRDGTVLPSMSMEAFVNELRQQVARFA